MWLWNNLISDFSLWFSIQQFLSLNHIVLFTNIVILIVDDIFNSERSDECIVLQRCVIYKQFFLNIYVYYHLSLFRTVKMTAYFLID